MDVVQMQVVSRDTPILTNYLTDMNRQLEKLRSHVRLLQGHVVSSDLDILVLKNHLLLSYILDLTLVVLKKCEGTSPSTMETHTERLVEIRTVIEKMRPLEQRFSYQLDKLLRIASNRLSVGSEHPLQFKPVPENLVSKTVDETKNDGGLSDEGSLGEGEPAGLYVPPRVVAMPYKEQSHLLPKSQVEKSKLINELRDELTDFPTEVQTSGGGFKKKLKDDKMRESYEEEYMVRVTNTRSKDLGRRAQQELADLVDFSSLKGLTKERGRGAGGSKRVKSTTHAPKKRTKYT